MIANGEIADADDFISSSAGASDAGKGVKLNPDGKLDGSFLRDPVRTLYTASATWTKSSGLRYVEVEVVGRGSNGGNETDSDSNDFCAPGGRAGGYAKKRISATALGSTESVSIAGGNAAFGSHCAGNADGTATGGDINLPGQQGQAGSSRGGVGGSTPLGTGGDGTSAADTNGGNASGYGAGGGGAGNSSTPSGVGGAGAPAAVIVTEFY